MVKSTYLFLGLVLLACDTSQDSPKAEPKPSSKQAVEIAKVTPEPKPKPKFKPVPGDLPEEDQYSSMSEACLQTVLRLSSGEKPFLNPKWRVPINAWCDHRASYSVSEKGYESVVDGSQIHDRDRPSAWKFYNRGVLEGWLNPQTCPYHKISDEKHPRKCRSLANNWPFIRPKMTSGLKKSWLRHPHGMEEFGARGPIDLNANVFRHMPGCWDPKSLERKDVAALGLILWSANICKAFGCRTKWDIKRHWGRGPRVPVENDFKIPSTSNR